MKRFAWMDTLHWSEIEAINGWLAVVALEDFHAITGFQSLDYCADVYRMVCGKRSGMELVISVDGTRAVLAFVPLVSKLAA